MSEDELKTEIEQVKYWEESLNNLTKQFEILLNSINLNKNIQLRRYSFIEQIKTNYRTKSKGLKQEPSHLYFITDIFFDFYSCLRDNLSTKSKEMLSQLSKTIKEIIQQIAQSKNETCNSTFRRIKRCKDLIISITSLENQYQKAKKSLDDAQIYQKKVKNVDKYTYNVGKKEKADLLLSEKIKEMEKIKKPLENSKKKLLEYRNKLKASLRDNFEIVVSISFKQLANYYQCLFLLLNIKIDNLSNIKGKIDDILTQLSNLIFELNDYSEKKFGETILGIKSEGISMISSEELMNKSSMKQLLEISKHVINYAKIFLICLRYRKKIMKFFLESIIEINKYEIDYQKEYDLNKRNLLNQLDSLKNFNNDSIKNWRNALSREKIGEITADMNAICPIMNNYIEFSRNEHKTFSKQWEDLEEKIKERQKLSIEFINELNEARASNKAINQREFIERKEKKNRKLKEAIKAGLEYIQKNVPTTREKDKNEMLKLESGFEKLFLNYQNINNELTISTEDELNNIAIKDIFEECKLIILKYFNRFKIQNYEGFLEKMKIKLLMNTNLNEEKLGKKIYKKLSSGMIDESKLSKNNILDDSESYNPFDNTENFQKFRAQSVYDKKNNNPFGPKCEINDLNISNNNNNIIDNNMNNNINNNIDNKINNININDTKNNINNINNNNINNNDIININSNNNIHKSINKNIINENINNDENVDNIEDNEYLNLSNNDLLNELENEDNLDLMDINKLTRYTEMKDPYSNIKEEELNRLLNMKEEETSSKAELSEGEKKIGTFNCSLSSQIISRGSLLITNKKIEFNSSLFKKVQIIIPLIDIVSIKKRTSLGIDNSIEVKTEKVTYLFTSFLSRDYCFSLLKNEINRVKEEAKSENQKDGENEEAVDANSPEQKYLGKKRFKAKQISKMLEEINFYKKLEEITNERMELFSKEYTDEKKGFFIPQKSFKRIYAEETFKDCPLFIIFEILKMTTQLEEYKVNKGFFESLFLNRGDTEVKFSENPEFSSKNPNYFDNGDYVMNLFSQFNKEDFENFLNEIQNWPHKYEYNCHAIHKVKQVPFGPSQVVMKDRFIAYFISPTLLIFDDMAYATEFTYCDNFVPLFRYRFDCKIKFNDNKGKFEFNTKLTISYITIFLVNFMLKGAVESKSNGDTEELIKGEVIDKLKDSINIYIDRFKDIFERATDETFQRKIDLKQNMITGEYEEDVIEGESPQDENVGEENNEKKEENNSEIEKNNENGGIHQKINEFIDKYKLYIFIGIIVVIIFGIIHSFFNKGKGSFALDTIFNLIILGSIFYLFKFK